MKREKVSVGVTNPAYKEQILCVFIMSIYLSFYYKICHGKVALVSIETLVPKKMVKK